MQDKIVDVVCARLFEFDFISGTSDKVFRSGSSLAALARLIGHIEAVLTNAGGLRETWRDVVDKVWTEICRGDHDAKK